jgi:hypothetical protein
VCETSNDWKPGAGQAINTLYAWIATEPDGGEGLATMILNGMFMPMIGADRERVQSLRPHAEWVHDVTGCPIKLKAFTVGVVIDEL